MDGRAGGGGGISGVLVTGGSICSCERSISSSQWTNSFYDKLSDKKEGWDEPYYAEFDECEENRGTCLSVYSDLLCDKHISDFNYYVACRNLLSPLAHDRFRMGGLLHDVPGDIQNRYNIEGLLTECAKPTETGARLKVKDELLEIFRTLNREYTWYKI